MSLRLGTRHLQKGVTSRFKVSLRLGTRTLTQIVDLSFGEDCGPTLIGKAMGTRNKYKLKWFTHDMQTLDSIRYYSNLPSARPRNKKPALGTPTPTLLCNGGRLHKNKRSMSARPSM